MLPRHSVLLLALACGAAGCGPDVEGAGDWAARPTAPGREPLRPDTPGNPEPPPRFDSTEVVERLEVADAGVVVHYTRAGRNAVAPADVDGSGVPDFVEDVGAVYREVLNRYHGEWAFRSPPDDLLVPDDNGGDGRLDVYLVDFALRADGAYRKECLALDAGQCPGYVTQENDFAGYSYADPALGTRIVSSHEYFHAVQAGYFARMSAVLSEGTAVWASERFDPALQDLEHFSAAYLRQPERSLDQEPTGPVDGYAYGAALFFECLADARGAEVLKALFDAPSLPDGWLPALGEVLEADGGAPLSAELERCFAFNLFTGARARPGYGHRRAELLPLAPVTAAEGVLEVPRVRLFRASSRYFRFAAPLEPWVLWWEPLQDGPDGGADWVQVRTASDAPGAPVWDAVAPGVEVVYPSADDRFLWVSHLQAGAVSVPVALCAGPAEAVAACRRAALDAGELTEVPDGGPPAPPSAATGCGCAEGTGSAGLVWGCALLAAALRRRRATPDGGVPAPSEVP